MGRPKKMEPRDRQFNVSLTATEYESLVKRAQNVGMQPIHFGRNLLADSDQARSATRETVTSVQRLIYSQLARIGNNLNQLMRHLHRTGDPVPADLEPLLKDIRQIIARAAPR